MLTYTHMQHGIMRHGKIEVSREDAIRAAVEHIRCVRLRGGQYVYRAEETGTWYRLTRDALAEAGAAILAGAGDWYSFWCASTGREMSARSVRRWRLDEEVGK